MDEQEIIKKLSEMHKEHSTDPDTLCAASLHEFNLDHPDIGLYSSLQGELFSICHDRGDAWTKI